MQVPHSSRMSRRNVMASSLGVAAASIVISPIGSARQATPIAESEIERKLLEFDAWLAAALNEAGVPGAAAGIVYGSRSTGRAYGITSIGNHQPVGLETYFLIGSTTKTVTATAVMRLVEQGVLDLDATVQTYMPAFRVADPDVSRLVQLRHLVTHTSGWLDSAPTDTSGANDDLVRYVAGMAALPQVAPLGAHFSYSNSGVSLLGHIIEQVTGTSYEDAIAELVLAPLRMTAATFEPTDVMTGSFAVGHTPSPGDPAGTLQIVEPWTLPRSMNPAGGLISTMEDQLRYARFHLGDGTVDGGTRILGAESMQLMRTPQGPGGSVPALDAPLEAVGVNWMLWNADGQRVVTHPGGSSGQMSVFALIPEHGFAITLLTNADQGLAVGLAAITWCLEHLLGIDRSTTEQATPEAGHTADWIGEFANPDGSLTVRIVDRNGLELHWLAAGQPEITLPLTPVGSDRATVPYLGLHVFNDLVRDDVGDVRWLRFIGRLVPKVA